MLRQRSHSLSSLLTVTSADGYPSPYAHSPRNHQRVDYHVLDPHRPPSPIFAKALTPPDAQRWASFMRATSTLSPALPSVTPDPARRDWLATHPGGLEAPWIPPPSTAAEEKRPPWPRRVLLVLGRHPAIPLVLRGVVWVFCLAALILGAQLLREGPAPNRMASPAMAVAVDSVALIYLLIVSRDEFAGGQVGIRSPLKKLRLVLLDLFFIVFAAANLALAFDALAESGAGAGGATAPARRDGHATVQRDVYAAGTPGADWEKQRSLAAVLLTGLVGWMMAFSISALRIMEKVAS